MLGEFFRASGERNDLEISWLSNCKVFSITPTITPKLMINQIDDIQSIDNTAVELAKNTFRESKEENLKRSFENICKLLPEEQFKEDTCRVRQQTEKGASSWLAVLPLKSLGYSLNMREFQDAIRLRYGWHIPDMPNHCTLWMWKEIHWFLM